MKRLGFVIGIVLGLCVVATGVVFIAGGGCSSGVDRSAAMPAPTQGQALESKNIASRDESLGPNRPAPSVPPSVAYLAVENEILPEGHNTESYRDQKVNAWHVATLEPLSTFSSDVDTASYANIRRFLEQQHQLPPKGAVRIEEMINYFTYNYPQPEGKHPFSVTVEVASCPWNTRHRLARIGLKGREISEENRKPTNLVFLIDTSGSMRSANKLELLRKGLRHMAEKMRRQDRVAIVVYAGSAGLVLESTAGQYGDRVIAALDKLKAGGSTNGGAGIQLAYKVARENYIEGGVNRVMLATDGDFNVGTTNNSDLVDLVKKEAESGVYLTVLGVGMGNYKDDRLEALADKGNGNYAYLDSLDEARKVLTHQGTLVTIAKDVKIQVEFNPAVVAGYRLVGYENRILEHKDFNDDRKDAGDVGAGHTVTALYEIVPAGVPVPGAKVDDLKYSKPTTTGKGDLSKETMTVKLRYKQPEGTSSTLLEVPVVDRGTGFDKADGDFRFVAAVAGFGMVLRDSEHRGDATLAMVKELARDSIGDDQGGYRKGMLKLVEAAERLGAEKRLSKNAAN